jgi:hypothetical protein
MTSRRARRRSGDTIIGAIILASATVALGIVVWGFAAGWFGVSLYDLTRNVNRDVLLIKTSSQLAFEFVNYTSTDRSVIVRNIAKVPLTITRVEIVSMDGQLKDYRPVTGIGYANLTRVEPGQAAVLGADVLPPCPTCQSRERLRMRIWYVASSLFDEANPQLSIDEMRYSETLFVYPELGVVSVCPLPESGWIMVNIVDPATYFSSGKIPGPPFNKIYIRTPKASSLADVDAMIQVTNSSGEVAYASSRIKSISNELQTFSGPFSGFQVPLKIDISTSELQVIQHEWVMGGIPGKAHASGVTLWYDAQEFVDVVEVEMGVNDAIGGRYRIVVTLYDCLDAPVGQGSVTVSFPIGVYSDSVFVDISPPVKMENVYKVEVRVEEA